jgi:pimeloyl-ACP methyl ester carboxylesterase
MLKRLVIAIVVLCVLYCSASWVFADMMVRNHQWVLWTAGMNKSSQPAEWGLAAREVELQRDVALHGWLLPQPEGPNNSTIVILAVPGYGVERRMTDLYPGGGQVPGSFVLARELRRRVGPQVALLLVDQRGTGESGGKPTIGVRESEDLLVWVQVLVEQGYRPQNIVPFGYSAGGAAVLFAADELGELGVRLVVLESPVVYRDLAVKGMARKIAKQYTGSQFGWLVDALYPGASLWFRVRTGAWIGQPQPIDAIRAAAHVPPHALFFVGSDEVIRTQWVDDLASALRAKGAAVRVMVNVADGRLYYAPGLERSWVNDGGHVRWMAARPEQYFAAIDEALQAAGVWPETP